MPDRKYVCSIAGFDPSAGAGVTADIKTFEMHKVYGFGVLTATTWQNDERVERVAWLSVTDIIGQLDLLIPKFTVDYFKIGILENPNRLLQICQFIKKVRPLATIIWDPVLRASADFPFFQGQPNWQELRGLVDWVTPNLPEFTQLFGSDEAALALSDQLTILKKGGHSIEQKGVDRLFYNKQVHTLYPQLGAAPLQPKHGSGCVLSAAICANLARGASPLEACERSKRYTEKLLSSHYSLLGNHTLAIP